MRPPETMPEGMRDAFTMGGRVPVEYDYYNDVPSRPLVLTREGVDRRIVDAIAGRSVGYRRLTTEMLEAWRRWPVRGQRMAVVGCERADYPALCLAHGAQSVTVVDRNVIISEHPRVRAAVPGDIDASCPKFDSIVAPSVVDHDGLGRYGDPIDPEADMKLMRWLGAALVPGGLLYLGVAVGLDCVVWNKGRIYGEIRLPLLLRGAWQTLYAPSVAGESRRPNRRPLVVPLLVLVSQTGGLPG